MNTRHYSLLDKLLIQIDAGLTTIATNLHATRPNPSADVRSDTLNPKQQRRSAGLMRVNHSGEVCAQALYNAQAVFVHDQPTAHMLAHAGQEEKDHLAWTHQRLQELNTHRSYLNLFWYTHAFLIGLAAGALGDGWSLGFVEETEAQVSEHLRGHLNKLPEADHKSRAIVAQMKQDEEQHGEKAHDAGAKALPWTIKKMMRAHAKVMTTLVYWI